MVLADTNFDDCLSVTKYLAVFISALAITPINEVAGGRRLSGE